MNKYNQRLLLTLPLMVLTFCAAGRPPKRPAAGGLQSYVEEMRGRPAEEAATGASLWSERRSRFLSLRDVTAREVHDIVTIEVVESTTASSQATTDTSKESSGQGAIPQLFGLEKGIAELPGLFDSSRSNEFQGDGSTTRRSALRTSLTAVVKERFPNGNLLLEGAREILINNERQILIVRGIVRSQDISPRNSVASNQIAQLELEVRGRGVVSRAQKPGILFKILNGIWPF